MPRNYVNGKIYKLVNNSDEEVYVGSTTSRLSARKCWHRGDAAKYPERRVYAHLNEVGWDSVSIILVEEFPCANEDQLRQRERHWYDEMKPSLNMIRPWVAPCPHGRQKDQCKQCGGVSICEHGRRKDQCKECGGASICEHGRRKATCKPCGGSRVCPHGRQKADCKQCSGITCACGCKTSKGNIHRHQRTKKHHLLTEAAVREFIYE